MPLDVRSIALLLEAGATRLHVGDLNALLQHPFAPGWRLWRADACAGAPPPVPPGAPHAQLPPWLAVLEDNGALVPAPPAAGWLRLLGDAPALRQLALENGDAEDTELTTPALGASLRLLRNASALRALALGFFDAADDATLAPLLRLRGLQRLELSHLPQLSDAFLRALCDALTALTHLRLDYLSVADQGLTHLDRLRQLTWLELRARALCTKAAQRNAEAPHDCRRAPTCISVRRFRLAC